MSASTHWSRYLSIAGTLFCAGQLLVAGSGCSQSATGSAKAPAARAHLSAKQVLEDLVAEYKATTTYADSGELHLQFDYGDDQRVDERVDFAVTLARPNKLRLHCYQAIVLSDGKKIHATIADLDKQVLEIASPEKLTLDAIYSDDALRQALTQQIAGASPQLSLLLSDNFLKTVLAEGSQPDFLTPDTVDDELCDRVEIKRPDGNLVLSIGQKTHTLRRIDFPTNDLGTQLTEQLGGPARGLKLWADLRGARLGGKIDEIAFEFEAPEGTKLVEQFDLRPLMPAPPEPSKLLGQKIGDFTFTRLDGSTVTPESLQGKITILDFWATWCAPCMESLPNLNRVYEKFKDDDRVQFLAVSVDQPDVNNDALTDTFTKIGSQVPIVRDSTQKALQTFHVEGIPNLFVIGPDGTVEDNEVGMNPAIADELPSRLEKLLAGESLHTEVLKRYEERKSQYEASLNEPLPAKNAAGSVEVRAQIASTSDPEHFTLTPLWTNDKLRQPGNILATTADDGSARLYVNVGWQSVAELDATGAVVLEQELKLPAMSVVSYLRSTIDGAGQRTFLGSASTQKQIHVFSETFAPLLAYPADEAEIADAIFTDLDGDGTPEICIAYWGTRGVESINLNGTNRWKAGTIENAFRLAQATLNQAEKPNLLVAQGRGSIAVFDAAGQAGSEISVDKRFVRAVFAADLNQDGLTELCALAPIDEGRDVLLGIDAQGKELWHYDLPRGIHEQPIEQVTWGKLGSDQANWIVACADGSIHVLAMDGTVIDHFNLGTQLTGLAVSTINDQPALVVAAPDKITAFEIKPKAAN